ncbi:putative DNA base hypermodification protein [Streptomyces cyaneofuscatus]|uniref:nucleotide kinase domain-containing protein n=1 Tax=Streptomyces cyaneofuscatus TaxID=66883 RepID=UPI002952D040|nr:nucleotide kinase domain-containing protein [Streptomyces cyaneofuscatus]WOP10949.1 putative DNA base hypermodification protein [Streptomyces cyaneofuscatus]
MVTTLQARPRVRRTEDSEPPKPLRIAGRVLMPTPVFDTYWRFAATRQQVYLSRLGEASAPAVSDPVLAQHRFTNCFRAADRVSQYLIGHVSYRGDQAWQEVFFRTLLFKFFNRIQTWQLLEEHLGEVTWRGHDHRAVDQVLSRAFASGERLYSAAYITPPPKLGEQRKHRNHLRLLELLMSQGAPGRVGRAASMQEAYQVLLGFPALGPFLAYQYLIDLNYAAELPFSEMDFVVPGPGARDGIRKCFGADASGIEAEVIRYMADTQEEHFARLGLIFAGLRGRPLQLIDCQNLFCEVDKYARVAHPDIAGISGRSRIKQLYRADSAPLTAWFPPKWGINS